jgi:hypothetical protein
MPSETVKNQRKKPEKTPQQDSYGKLLCYGKRSGKVQHESARNTAKKVLTLAIGMNIKGQETTSDPFQNMASIRGNKQRRYPRDRTGTSSAFWLKIATVGSGVVVVI